MSSARSSDRRFALSTGGKNLGKITSEKVVSWEDLVKAFLTRPSVKDKDSGFYVFGQFKNNHRSRAALILRSALVLDIEAQEPGADTNAAIEELRQRLEGYNALYYTTYSFDAGLEEYRYRMVIPLEKDITGTEYSGAVAALIHGIEDCIDPSCLLPEQCSFVPALSDDKAHYECWRMSGDRFYSPDKIITKAIPTQEAALSSQGAIQEHYRNNTLSAYAFKMLKRYGNVGDEACSAYIEESRKCQPPLSSAEINSIWHYAQQAYNNKILTNPNYVVPELYGSALLNFKQVPEGLFDQPFDYSGVGLSNLFCRGYSERIRFSKALGWMCWTGEVWKPSDLAAQETLKDLTAHMLDDANDKVRRAHANLGEAKASGSSEDKAAAEAEVKDAEKYQKFALRSREANKINGALKLASSAMEIKVADCDRDPYLLNTPDGIVDLNTGEVRPHDPTEYCTKITAYAPSDTAHDELWDDFLDTITMGDKELQRYIQTVIGAALIGKVYTESVVIAYGSGANGKSTLFNALYRILGSYAGKIPAEALTSKNTNYKNILAELLGLRYVIASETEEGQRLSNSMLKQIASTDDISAEKKYKDPFNFEPSHQTILCTNYLPKVSGMDYGTLRRLVVVPFNATIPNPQTDFLERLLNQSGGVILRWMIEGTKMYIDAGRKFPPCQAVMNATNKYKKDNDWLAQFLDELCVVDNNSSERAGNLYSCYNDWAKQTSGYARSKVDFSAALEERGFDHFKDKQGAHWMGLRLRQE